jgi:peroxiredoxin
MTLSASAQDEDKSLRKIPSVTLHTTDGQSFNTSGLSNNGNPMIISFWALWCKPCVNELTTINDVYDDWVEETGVKLVAVSIDDTRSSSKVMPFVNGKGWSYEILLDPNGDFKRAMNVNLIPHTFLINGNGEIVWQHTSFTEGSELELIDLVRKLKAGENLSDDHE